MILRHKAFGLDCTNPNKPNKSWGGLIECEIRYINNKLFIVCIVISIKEMYNIINKNVDNKNVEKGNIMFIGRDNELKTLKNKFDSNNLEVGLIYGQRRIGKTSLIVKGAEKYKNIYFLSKDTTYSDNLSHFSNVVKDFLESSLPVRFESIDEIFNFLKDYAKKEKLVLIIDELPFLAHVYPGIISFLQGYIDELNRLNVAMKLILSGSDISFMLDLLKNKAKPLYQRATFQIHVLPMLFSDAVKMLDGFNSEDKVRYLSIFGNRPYYLEKLDNKQTFDQNITRLCFSSDSILIDAPNLTLPIGYSNNGTYIAILTAIANRKHRVKEISDELHIDSNALATYLKRMVDGESIEKRETFNGNQKTNYYEISDPMIRFYYGLIYPNLEDIERRLGKEIYLVNNEKINSFIEHGFEDVVNSYMDEQNSKGRFKYVYHSFKKFVVDNSILGRSIEIDGLAESLNKKHLAVIEAKYRNKDVSMKILSQLKESASIFAEQYNSVDYYIFSKTSFADDLAKSNDPSVKLISLKDMLQLDSSD